jgi:hypothetical protein
MFATGRMVQSVASQLDRDGGNKALRGRLLNEGCDLIDKLRLEADRDARIGELVTCSVERGYVHEQQNEPGPAKTAFQQAIDLAIARHRKTGGVDAALAIVEAREEMAAYLKRQNDIDGTDAELAKVIADAQTLSKVHDARHEFAAAEGRAWEQRGGLVLNRGDRAAAGRDYDAAAEAVERAVTLSFGEPEASQIAWLIRLHLLAGEQRRALNDSDGALQRFARAGEVRTKIDGGKVTPEIDLDTAIAMAFAGDLQKRRGDGEAAAKSRMEATAAVARAMASAKIDDNQKQRAQRLQALLEQQAGSAPDKP